MPTPTDPANVRGPMPAKPAQTSPMGMSNAPYMPGVPSPYAPMGWASTPFYAVRPQQFSWGMQPQGIRAMSAASPLPTPIPGNSPHGNIRQDDVNQAWQAMYGGNGFGGPPISVNPGPIISVTGGSPEPLSTWGGLPFGAGYTPAGSFPSGPGGAPMNWYNGPTYVGGNNPGFGTNNFGGGFDPFGTGGSFKLPEQKPDYQG